MQNRVDFLPPTAYRGASLLKGGACPPLIRLGGPFPLPPSISES